MQEAGANTQPIEKFLSRIDDGVENALIKSDAPKAATRFVNRTFSLLNKAPIHVVASMFTFGREEVIPNMFRSIIDKIDQDAKGKLKTFIYYLDRHIGIDEDEHGTAALKMIKELCKEDDNKWTEAAQAAKKTMQARVKFWDEILLQMNQA